MASTTPIVERSKGERDVRGRRTQRARTATGRERTSQTRPNEGWERLVSRVREGSGFRLRPRALSGDTIPGAVGQAPRPRRRAPSVHRGESSELEEEGSGAVRLLV